MRTFMWGRIWGLVFGGVVFGLTLWTDVQVNGEIQNLTPPVALFLGVLAFFLGWGILTVLSRSRSWANWQLGVALAGAAFLLGLLMLRDSGVWPRNDSKTLVHRLHNATNVQLPPGVFPSSLRENIVSFQPPKRAGYYEILIAGDQTPAWITDRPLERLWVQYPESCGRIGADSSKPHRERRGPEMSSTPTCGGLLWGGGWTFIPGWLNNVPVTLKVEKRAGELTEMVFRARDGIYIYELVELR